MNPHSRRTIRPFRATDDEYGAIVAVHAAAWPDERHFPAAQWRETDEEWPQGYLLQRVVLLVYGRILGFGTCSERYWQDQPGTVFLDFTLHPDADDPTAEALLYDHLLQIVRRERPSATTLAAETREDRPDRVRFLADRGFRPALRSPRAALDVLAFDPAPYAALQTRLAAAGIRIETLADLQRRAAGWKSQLYELRWAIIRDVPAVEPPARPTLAEFEQMILDDPALDEAAWFLAVDETAVGRPLVGMSNLWLNDPARRRLDAGLTGVLRPYRRRGIATALKVQTIRFAQRLGAATIATANEEDNPMFALNLRLGFRPLPAWISYRKALP